MLLVLAEQVEREDVVAQVELQRGPVDEVDAIAEAEVEGRPALVDELVLPTPAMRYNCEGRARRAPMKISPGNKL